MGDYLEAMKNRQKRSIEKFNKLCSKDSDKARELSFKRLYKAGIIDDQGNISEKYNILSKENANHGN